MTSASIPAGLVPNWAGFGLAILAGIAAIVVGAVMPYAGLIALGVAIVAGSILAWWSGARATPEVNPFKKSFGATISRIDGTVWGIIFALVLVAALIAIFTRP